VLPGSAAASLLRQCSRGAPPPGEATWQPLPSDIVALESALPATLRSRPELNMRRYESDPDWSRFPLGWQRQYGGIVRGGRRFIYGNFYPHAPGGRALGDERWRSEPIYVCDGGAYFFGVEYDVAGRRFTHLAFNGAL